MSFEELLYRVKLNNRQETNFTRLVPCSSVSEELDQSRICPRWKSEWILSLFAEEFIHYIFSAKKKTTLVIYPKGPHTHTHTHTGGKEIHLLLQTLVILFFRLISSNLHRLSPSLLPSLVLSLSSSLSPPPPPPVLVSWIEKRFAVERVAAVYRSSDSLAEQN